MGMVWEAYGKGVPLLGVPENPTESPVTSLHFQTNRSSAELPQEMLDYEGFVEW